MKHYLIALLAVFLVGCDDSIDGIFTANTDLNFSGKNSSVVVPAGDYSAEVKFRSKKRIDLVLEQGDSEFSIRFDVPKAISFEENSSFEISSDLSGQPYHVVGGNETNIEYGDIRERIESCSEIVPIRECYINQYGEYICRVRYVTRWGDRRVTVQPYTKESINYVNLFDGDAEVADFQGRKVTRGQKYLNMTRCFVNHYPYPPSYPYYP